jgi:hypothetical protein
VKYILDFLNQKDGLAFCAILHKFHPELIPFHLLQPEKKHENLGLAYKVDDFSKNEGNLNVLLGCGKDWDTTFVRCGRYVCWAKTRTTFHYYIPLSILSTF